MAWLQNLAGHAENLLNKIDQNAATVLNDGNKADEEKGSDFLDLSVVDGIKGQSVFTPIKEKLSRSSSVVSEENLKIQVDDKDNFTTISEKDKEDVPSVSEEAKPDRVTRSNTPVSINSFKNSYIESQELEALQAKVAKLELENQDVHKQLLNLQHIYSEVRNENNNLQFQIERLNDQLTLAQSEKEQYVARAQRILQEKEKLISLKHEDSATGESDKNTFTRYNEELKKELEFQQAKVAELTEKNDTLLNDLQSFQMQHQVIQQGLNQSNQSLEQSLASEKRLRLIAEEDCANKTKELQQFKTQEITKFESHTRRLQQEIDRLKEELTKKPVLPDNADFESRLRSLTQTLMLKQNNLETVTTERNALRLQLEKLEAKYMLDIDEMRRDRVKIIDVSHTRDGDRVSVPNFMRVSPYDRAVTRRVKHAYSTFDAISVRTGIFLRRYPLARIFVFCYMIILHIWVLMVLFWDAPSN